MSATRVPVSVLVTTRNEEANLASTLAALDGWAGEVHVLDSESSDRTLEIAREHGCLITSLPYEHGRIIPWIFQWGLEHLTLGHEWILLLEADQRLTEPLKREIAALLARPAIEENGFYLRRRQIFRGRAIRFGGYGGKRLLKLFRRGAASSIQWSRTRGCT